MLEQKIKKVFKLMESPERIDVIKDLLQKQLQKKQELKAIKQNHIISRHDRKKQLNATFIFEPKISIITPLYNTSDKFLKELIKSVKKQTYSNWELCLADGSDNSYQYIQELCQDFAHKDSRIIYKKLEQNEGIVGNTNKCISFATGEFLGLLDHDDLLHESALFEVVKELERGAEFVYTDEMKFLKKVEKSTDIVCKSGFGKDELRSHNYICHFVVFKRSLLDSMDSFYRKECEGSQDYDMVLRLSELTDKIIHIPKILYYWRIHDNSVAKNLSVKQYAVDAAKRALTDHLARNSMNASVSCNMPYETIYRIRYEIPDDPLVTIMIWNEGKLVDWNQYVEELLRGTDYNNLEIIVEDQITDYFKFGGLKIKQLKREGNVFSWFNKAAELANGEHLIFLNKNCFPICKMWIQEMLMYTRRADVCAVGSHILYKNGKTYYGGAVIDCNADNKIHVLNYGREKGEAGYEANLKHVRNTTGITSLCMMVSKYKFSELGGFDDKMSSLSDIDFCLRGKERKYVNVWTCFSILLYKGNKSVYDYLYKNERFYEIWKEKLMHRDEFCHPFLRQRDMI